MYLTVLTGRVAREDWTVLRHSFGKMSVKPPSGLVETDLIQNTEDPCDWQVITLWASQEAYEEATRLELTAACEQMFCQAGSVPRRTEYKLVTRYQRI